MRGNQLPQLHKLFFSIRSKGSFIYTIPDRIAHTTAFIGLNEKYSMGPPWGIDPTTHCTMIGCSTTTLHLAPSASDTWLWKKWLYLLDKQWFQTYREFDSWSNHWTTWPLDHSMTSEVQWPLDDSLTSEVQWPLDHSLTSEVQWPLDHSLTSEVQ